MKHFLEREAVINEVRNFRTDLEAMSDMSFKTINGQPMASTFDTQSEAVSELLKKLKNLPVTCIGKDDPSEYLDDAVFKASGSPLKNIMRKYSDRHQQLMKKAAPAMIGGVFGMRENLEEARIAWEMSRLCKEVVDDLGVLFEQFTASAPLDDGVTKKGERHDENDDA